LNNFRKFLMRNVSHSTNMLEASLKKQCCGSESERIRNFGRIRLRIRIRIKKVQTRITIQTL
jgi:hypothetical protein